MNIFLSTKTIDIAEYDNFMILEQRLCYYDDKNLNNVMLPYADDPEKAEKIAQTLVNMPVQARYKKINGKDDLGGHEMYTDKDGNVQFDTMSIGVHTEAYIKEDEVTTVSGETKTLPCLFAKARLWTRYPNTIAAIKRLYESDGGLNSSWEISTKEYTYANGVKTLTDYEFIANTCLGSLVTPAYAKTANAISLSEEELMVAEALSQDLGSVEDINLIRREKALEDEIKVVSEEDTPITEPVVSENEEVDESVCKPKKKCGSSDDEDEAVCKPKKKCSEDESDESVCKPKKKCADEEEDDESVCKPKKKCAESDDEEESAGAEEDEESVCKPKKKCAEDDDEESVCKPKKKCAEISSLTDRDIYIQLNQQLDEMFDCWGYVSYVFPEEHYALYKCEGMPDLDYIKVDYAIGDDMVSITGSENVTLTISMAEVNSYIASKDEAILKASEEIIALKAEIAELNQYKEKFEQSEQERIAAEIAEKKEELVATITKSGLITREEISESIELSGYVESLNKKALMEIVGERLLASVADKKADIEISETKKTIKHNIDAASDDEEITNKADLMRKYYL